MYGHDEEDDNDDELHGEEAEEEGVRALQLVYPRLNIVRDLVIFDEAHCSTWCIEY